MADQYAKMMNYQVASNETLGTMMKRSNILPVFVMTHEDACWYNSTTRKALVTATCESNDVCCLQYSGKSNLAVAQSYLSKVFSVAPTSLDPAAANTALLAMRSALLSADSALR